MDNNTFKIGQTYYPGQPITTSTNQQKLENNNKNFNFNSILQDKLNESQDIKFSNHAKQRLESRGIKLDNNTINQLNNAVNKASAKGAKDSLVLMNDLAFVVNVPNRTVVTTLDGSSMKEHIFTNIDSAVII